MPSRHVLLIVAGLLFAACGGNPVGPGVPPPVVEPPPPPPPPPPPAPVLGITRILAFGDSMTAGTTSPPLALAYALSPGLPQSYPFKLHDLLAGRYTEQAIETHNAGQPGEYAEGGRERLGGVLQETQAEVVLLMEGANDLNNMGHLSDSEIPAAIQRVLNAVEDMVRATQRHGVTVMVATLPPQREGGRRAGGAAFLNRYNDGLRSMTAKKDALLVDLHAEVPLSMIGEDGLHPTEEGYQKIAEIFAAALSQRYEVTNAGAWQ